MTRRAILSVCALALLAAGCGLREPLQPAQGQAMPPAPAFATRALTFEELLAVPTEMRPLRVDEPLTRSERRPIDRFELPPPDVAGATEGEPSELEEEPAPADQDPTQR